MEVPAHAPLNRYLSQLLFPTWPKVLKLSQFSEFRWSGLSLAHPSSPCLIYHRRKLPVSCPSPSRYWMEIQQWPFKLTPPTSGDVLFKEPTTSVHRTFGLTYTLYAFSDSTKGQIENILMSLTLWTETSQRKGKRLIWNQTDRRMEDWAILLKVSPT